MEGDIAAMQSDLDEAINAQRAAEERADRLHQEMLRLAEELRQEQENYKNAESLRKQLEIEIREITVRLEEAEAFAMREGKRMVAKLQARVRSPLSFIVGFTWSLLPVSFTIMFNGKKTNQKQRQTNKPPNKTNKNHPRN